MNKKVNNDKLKFERILEPIKEELGKLKCLDIGGAENTIRTLIPRTTIMDITLENTDISFSLTEEYIKKGKLPIKRNEYDIITLSQILEHTITPIKIMHEILSKSEKYAIIGLPNDLTIDNRIRLLSGKSEGFNYYGHKQTTNYKQINEFVKETIKHENWEIINTYNHFATKGGRIMPIKIREWLAKQLPTLFCKEKLWLLKRKEKI